MMKNFLRLILLAVISLTGCTFLSDTAADLGGYENIDVETLETMIEERRDEFIMVNTHIPFEGNIPDTDFSVPYTEIEENLDMFPEDKDAEIVVYCLNDPMSHIAAAELTEHGYTNVKNLVGGMNAWQDAGLPLEMTP